MRKDIKQLVNYYVRKFNTRNPYDLAKSLNVEVQIGELGSRAGCYMFLKNHKCVFLNEDLEENEMRLVMAHELAHSIMHRKENCYFIRNKTLLLTSKMEIEANTFAAELLIPDELILENPGISADQIARIAGYDKKIMNFKNKILI
ncbi:MAG: ImmA/IrrE family metallo-endopeptidase [Roseburia faecis]|nr:ImmA/IrrE family metallo-endopeptidase [Roseburia faecis]MEE1519168.1 ImmA/IrrE family metallo-endopeptidase [Dialister invisus]